MRGLIAAVASLAVAVAVGFAGGVVLERSGRVDPVAEPDPATVRDSRALVFDCPDGTPIVVLGRADRIAVTGRDEASVWVELRSPFDPGAAVWMPAAQVDLDSRVDALPVHPCGDPPTTPATIPPDPGDDRPRTTTTTRAPRTTTTLPPRTTTTTEADSVSVTTSTSSSTSSTSPSTTGTSSPDLTTTTESPENGAEG